MITEEQRKARITGIFSSDVPRIMNGESVDVFLEKIGEKEPVDLSEIEYVELGNQLEPAVLDGYERERGMIKRNIDTMRHPHHNFLGAHLDGMHKRPLTVVEGKVVGIYNKSLWGEAGTDQVPDRVLWQVQTQMAVAGAAVAMVPVAFATERALTQFITKRTVPITLYEVPRSDVLIAALIDKCSMVWQCIKERRPPPMEKPSDALMLYRVSNGEAIIASNEIAQEVANRKQVSTAIKTLEQSLEDLDLRIKSYMGAASELWHDGKRIVTWKNDRDSEVFDRDRFKEEQAGMYSEYLRTKTGARKFLVK